MRRSFSKTPWITGGSGDRIKGGRDMGPEWTAVVIASIAAFISVAAAIYSSRQAAAAKRQADAAHGDVEPTFHAELHKDRTRPPWGFRLTINNYNRRPLRVDRVRFSN